jgi:hypothetical protein
LLKEQPFPFIVIMDEWPETRVAAVSLAQLYAGLYVEAVKQRERCQLEAHLMTTNGLSAADAKMEAHRLQEQAVIASTLDGHLGGARIGIFARCVDWPCDARLLPTDALARAHPFERDRFITFDEASHVYHVRGQKVPFSVTSVAHATFPPFDAVEKIRNMSQRTRQEKYAGLTDQEIAQAWDRHRHNASTLGTKMHAAIEVYLNTHYLSRDPAIAIEMRKVRRFVQEEIVNKELDVWRTEPIVFTDQPLLAGSVDCLLRRRCDGKFVVMDWKRSKEIKMTARGSFGYGYSFKPKQPGGDPKAVHATPHGVLLGPDPGFELIENTNFHHYSLQLHLYRLIFMRHYHLDIPLEELYIVVFHPDQPGDDYEIKRAAPYADKAQWLIDNYATVAQLVAAHQVVEERVQHLVLGGDSSR